MWGAQHHDVADLPAVVDWDLHCGVLVVDDLDRCAFAATTDEFRRYSATTSPSLIRNRREHVIPFSRAGLSLPAVKTVDQEGKIERSTRRKPLRAKRRPLGTVCAQRLNVALRNTQPVPEIVGRGAFRRTSA
jgi:hypothetical protein